MGELILILGGARSGKSDYGQRLAEELGGQRVLFVATAEARDDEMRARIKAHQHQRPDGWRTLEAPLDVSCTLPRSAQDAQVILLDCLTLLVSNILLAQGKSADEALAHQAVMDEIYAILQWLKKQSATVIVVSNEVGLGLVPPYPLGRMYRDLLGRANCLLAAEADQVYMMFAGLPIELRALTTARLHAQKQ
jgi:adenosylcobinamide kinase/adenosylcobinamide-phosphate guanylyltransferase